MDTSHAVGCAALRQPSASCTCQRPLTRVPKQIIRCPTEADEAGVLNIKKELLAIQAQTLRLYKKLPPFHSVGQDLTEMLSLIDYALSHGIQGGKK